MVRIALAELVVRVDAETRARLAREAARSNRAAEAVPAEAIARLVARQDAEREAIEQAVAEVDAGAFVASAAMSEWMRAWEVDDEQPPPAPDVHRS